MTDERTSLDHAAGRLSHPTSFRSMVGCHCEDVHSNTVGTHHLKTPSVVL